MRVCDWQQGQNQQDQVYTWTNLSVNSMCCLLLILCFYPRALELICIYLLTLHACVRVAVVIVCVCVCVCVDLVQLVRLVRLWPYHFLWQSYKELLTSTEAWTILSALYHSLVSVQSAIPLNACLWLVPPHLVRLHLVNVACACASTCSIKNLMVEDAR